MLKNWKPISLFLLTVVLLILIQACAGALLFVFFDDYQKRSAFGDMFGVVNTLFAGLAFAGVIFTIYLQSEELGLQRKELQRTAKAQEESEKSLRDQVEASRLQLRTMQDQLEESRNAAKGQNLLALVNFLQDEKVQDARRIVMRPLSSKSFSQWTEEDERAAVKVCTTYDVAGIIIRAGLIPAEPILNNWGASIKKCYETLEPYIRTMQKKNGPNYWDDFHWLYEEAKYIDSGKSD